MSLAHSNFDRQIAEIKEAFNALSKVVDAQCKRVIALFDGNNNEASYPIIEKQEDEIDLLEVKIRNEVVNTIVLYTPRAIDGRKMFAYIDITGFLERVGDLLLNIAHYERQLDRSTLISQRLVGTLQNMLHTAVAMVNDSMIAFAVSDTLLARQIIERDTEVDDINKRMWMEIPDILEETNTLKPSLRAALIFSSISYNIERIADNATNIAEAVIYHAEGHNIRHASLTENE